MIEPKLAFAVLAGAVLALPYVIYAQRLRLPRTVFGTGLIVAAVIYVGFAAVAADLRAVAVETAGLALFTVVAILGMRRWFPLLALGWCAHMLWDLLLHPVAFSGHAPWWYPVVCVGFDLLVAGCILGMDRRAS